MNRYVSLWFAFIVSLILSISMAYADEKDGIFAAENFSSTLSFTTDYVVDGISYSDQDPAVQGSFDYSHPGSGIFVGLWGSSWDDGGVSNEVELGVWAGQAGVLGPISYDVTAYYWFYPGAKDNGFEYDYFQLGINLSHTFEQIPLSPSITLGGLWSPEYSGEEGTAYKVIGKLGFSLFYGLGLELEIGHSDIEGGKLTGNGKGLNGGNGYDWEYYRIGISRELIAHFSADLSYYMNSEDEFFKGYYSGRDVAGNRLVFTISRTF